ncbi:gamma-glutamylcyclotransferase family protein [Fodinicurvata halophila]|uniref:Gamma-glutamylcyclotransferase family protein n=1 Tax=Fodinicurvata halophila TaxID=1419723 RepID=A0ABV8UK43_9PROT
MSFLYFAYGSNMLTTRLQARCPSARPLGRAVVQGWCVDFVKPGRDGSAKAGLLPDSEGEAHGVLFGIARADLPALDRAEAAGKGYDRADSFVVFSLAEDGDVPVVTYLPRQTRKDLLPYDWYHRLCLEGARQHDLPLVWLAKLEAVATQTDPNPKRAARLHALEALRLYQVAP